MELKLAAFQHERGRDDVARETLRTYVEGAKGDGDRSKRIAEAARTLADLRMPGEALSLLEGWVQAGRADRAHWLLVAQLTEGADSSARAVEALERAWTLSQTLEEREDVDERLFNLLRARAGEGDTTEPDQEEGQVWKELWDFYDKVKQNAPDDAAAELRYRAAWWAVRIGDRDEAYRILPLLHDPKNPVLAYEELLLDLAERTDNQALVVRQLELIAEIDPRREEEALIRKAEMRLKLNFEDEAIRMLQALVNRPGASLKAVQALARAYLQQGRYRALDELWSKAFAKANLLERREILEPYTETLAKLGKIPDALEIYAKIIPGESDLAQRRKLFDDQLALASRHYLLDGWMRPRYEALSKSRPLDSFYPEALARVLQATGKHADAFAAMKRAYYLSGGESTLLQPLGELASKAGDLDAAIYFQRQLIAGSGATAAPEEWLGLIARLEETLDLEGAARVRRELETKFGQDGDFLRQLARAAQTEGDATGSARIWGQVTALRPWDAASRFEYGMLQLEMGQTKEAEASFDAVLTATATARDGAEAFPIWPAAREEPEVGQAFGPPLQVVADALDRFPFLQGPPRDETVASLLQTPTEFLRTPPDVHGLRLRAIEELGRLQGDPDAWGERWRKAKDPERIWAAIHGGASEWGAGVVQELVERPEIGTFLGRFRYAVLSLRTGNDARLLAWAGSDAERRYHVILAMDVLLRDPSFVFAPQRLTNLVQKAGLRIPDARRLMQNLYQSGLVREALHLGEAVAEAGAGPDYIFYQDVADMASDLGDEAVRERWNQEAFAALDFQFRVLGRIPFATVHRITTDVLALQPQRWPWDRVIKTLHERLAAANGLTAAERAEGAMWISLAIGQTEKALQQLEGLAGLSPTPRIADPEWGAGIGAVEATAGWERIEDLLVLVGDRVPFREPLDRMAGLLLDRMRPTSGVGSEDANRQFAEVRIRHLLWTLETANRPVRQRLIQEFLAMACGEDLHFDLALGLEKQGMAAEALPVYAELLQKDSTSIEAARGYFNACRLTHAYDEALAMIDAYREGLLVRPKAMTSEFLHRSRATFLYLSGRVEDLTRVAQEGQLGESGPGALDSTERVIYQRALAAVYEERDDVEAAVRVYESLREGADGLTKPDQIHLADCYLQLGRDGDAAKILADFKLRPGDSNADPVIQRMSAIEARRGADGGAGLRQLAVQAGRLGVSVEVCGQLATALAAAGWPEVADALLDLRARRTPDRAQRFEATRQRIALRQSASAGPGKILPPDPALLVSWMRGWAGDVAEGEAILRLAETATPEQRAGWIKAREIVAAEPQTRLLGELLRLAEGASPVEVSAAIRPSSAGESSGALRLAAKVLNQRGQPEEARRWIAEVHRRQEANPLDDTALVLAICQAGGDSGGLTDWRDRLSRFPGTSSRFIELAAEFFQVGRRDLALGLMAERYASFRVLTEEQRFFLNEYARHLIREGVLDQARRVLLAMFQKTVGGDPVLLVDYYKAAGKLDQLEGELDKFYLSKSERAQVMSLLPPGAKARRGPETSAVR